MRRTRNDCPGVAIHSTQAAGLTREALTATVPLLMVRLIAFIATLLTLSGCASGPPVQEMSDARQAIAAARVAGATEAGSPDLYAAQAAIARAESHLQAQEYVRARYAAIAAKHHAALALSEAQQGEAARASAP